MPRENLHFRLELWFFEKKVEETNIFSQNFSLREKFKE